ncbi:hypothetical protein HJG60_010030 [Phyllostomus discolor]|uniref:Uncharacterized protein n=1 Tax=Phyllostomus discolor TaxID=89673 RepID=A0A834AVU2_9CHIR|nr:hypothetical protein HJG60_010030 [Phyllostomus discolor]
MRGAAVPGEKDSPQGEQVPGSCLCGPVQLRWEARCQRRAGARLSQLPPGPLQCPVSAPGAAFRPRCPHTRARAAHARDAERGPWCPARAAAPVSFSLVTWYLRLWARDWRCRTSAALPASCSSGSRRVSERAGWPHVGQGRDATWGAHRLQGKTHSPQQKRMGPELPVAQG